MATFVHIIQEIWQEKKPATTLFIDVKEAFEHVSKRQLLTYIIKLGIDGDLVT